MGGGTGPPDLATAQPRFVARGVSLIVRLDKTTEILCKANRATLHYVLFFLSVRPQEKLYRRYGG